MNVTKGNFDDVVEQFESHLPSAAFVAVDAEMTGISLPGLPEKLSDVLLGRIR